MHSETELPEDCCFYLNCIERLTINADRSPISEYDAAEISVLTESLIQKSRTSDYNNPAAPENPYTQTLNTAVNHVGHRIRTRHEDSGCSYPDHEIEMMKYLETETLKYQMLEGTLARKIALGIICDVDTTHPLHERLTCIFMTKITRTPPRHDGDITSPPAPMPSG